jgi:hypothetical protein
MLKLRSIGVRDYSVFGRTRFAGERIPGVWLWNVNVHLAGGLPMGSARDLDTAKAEFGGARTAVKARTAPSLLAAYRDINIRDGDG